jgi:hypothetical protein
MPEEFGYSTDTVTGVNEELIDPQVSHRRSLIPPIIDRAVIAVIATARS